MARGAGRRGVLLVHRERCSTFFGKLEFSELKIGVHTLEAASARAPEPRQ